MNLAHPWFKGVVWHDARGKGGRVAVEGGVPGRAVLDPSCCSFVLTTSTTTTTNHHPRDPRTARKFLQVGIMGPCPVSSMHAWEQRNNRSRRGANRLTQAEPWDHGSWA